MGCFETTKKLPMQNNLAITTMQIKFLCIISVFLFLSICYYNIESSLKQDRFAFKKRKRLPVQTKYTFSKDESVKTSNNLLCHAASQRF